MTGLIYFFGLVERRRPPSTVGIVVLVVVSSSPVSCGALWRLWFFFYCLTHLSL